MVYFFFLKLVSSGDHTIFNNVRLTPTGALASPGITANFADISIASMHVNFIISFKVNMS